MVTTTATSYGTSSMNQALSLQRVGMFLFPLTERETSFTGMLNNALKYTQAVKI